MYITFNSQPNLFSSTVRCTLPKNPKFYGYCSRTAQHRVQRLFYELEKIKWCEAENLREFLMVLCKAIMGSIITAMLIDYACVCWCFWVDLFIYFRNLVLIYYISSEWLTSRNIMYYALESWNRTQNYTLNLISDSLSEEVGKFSLRKFYAKGSCVCLFE